jgi:small multidrug resistance pump
MIAIAAFTVAGDYFLKLASLRPSPLKNSFFLAGLVIYALCAFAWVYVMRDTKLATIGVVYSISTILFLTALGLFAFNEHLSGREIAGVGCAVAAILLLCKFG